MVRILQNNLGVRFGVKFMDKAWSFVFLIIRLGLAITCLYTLISTTWEILSTQYTLMKSRKIFTKDVSFINGITLGFILFFEFCAFFLSIFIGLICFTCASCCCGVKVSDLIIGFFKCFAGFNAFVGVFVFAIWFEPRDLKLVGIKVPGFEY